MIEEFGTSARPPVRLGAIAGRWRTEGMVLGDEPVPVRGTDTYELLPGGFYLVHWVDVTVGDQAVRAIEIIGERVAGTDAVLARAYDDTGAMTVMQVHIGADGVWRFSGGAGIAPAARPDGRADDGAASDAGAAAGDEAAAADEAAAGRQRGSLDAPCRTRRAEHDGAVGARRRRRHLGAVDGDAVRAARVIWLLLMGRSNPDRPSCGRQRSDTSGAFGDRSRFSPRCRGR